MVLAVPDEKWPALQELCRQRGCRGDRPGRVRRHGPADAPLRGPGRRRPVDGVPPRRPADGRPRGDLDAARGRPLEPPDRRDFTADLVALLAHWDVCSKEWIVRQYDHEVQATDRDQAAGGHPRRRPGRCGGRPAGRGLDARAGGRLRHQPALWQDRPLRDGGLRHRRGDSQLRRRSAPIPTRIAILDNFCWGNTERPETLGSLVLRRAGMPRRFPGLRDAVHLGEGQPVQRIHARGQEPGDPSDALDQRHRARARRPRSA